MIARSVARVARAARVLSFQGLRGHSLAGKTLINQTRSGLIKNMKTLTITESKAHLSSLVEKVYTSGKSITIGRAGKPMVQLVKFTPARGANRIGAFKGKINIAPDFDTWEGEEAAAFGLFEKES